MTDTVNENTPLIAGKEVRQKSREKWKIFKKHLRGITVEPYMFLQNFALGMDTVFVTNLWVDKICYHTYNSTEICRNLDTKYPAQQDVVQRQVTEYNTYNNICQYLPGVFILMLLGSWGDNRDRKIPVIIPQIGLALKGLALMLNGYWFWAPTPFMLVPYILYGFTGCDGALYMTTYAYLTIVSDEKSRTTRFAIINVIYYFISMSGTALSNYLFNRYGYVGVFGVLSIFAASGVTYTILRLEMYPNGVKPFTGNGILKVFSPGSLKKSVLVFCRSRPDRARGYILATFACLFLLVFNYGYENFTFIFTRKKFAWDHDTYSVWSVFDTPWSAIGLMIVLPILSYRFRIGDYMVAFIGGISMLFKLIVQATAPYPWVMYLSSVIGMCGSMMVSSCRSAVSKLVDEGELGSIFAVMGTVEAVLPVLSSVVFMAIYNATLDFFPGMVFVMGALNVIVVLCILVWIMVRRLSRNIPLQEVTLN